MSNLVVFSEQSAADAGIRCVEKMPAVELVITGSRSKRIVGAAAYFCVDAGAAWVFATVPAGFETDLDSVPRIVPLAYAWFKGRTTVSAVLHDFLYKNQVNRELADKAFLRAMQLEGVRKRYRLPIYWAVRLFGGRFYGQVLENRK